MNATATLLDTGYVLITGGAASPTDYKGTARRNSTIPATRTFHPPARCSRHGEIIPPAAW